MEIADRLKAFGLGCPKCVPGILRRLHLCNDCTVEDCYKSGAFYSAALGSGVSVLVVRCENYSGR